MIRHAEHRISYVRIALILFAALTVLLLLPAAARPQVPTGPPCGNRAEVVDNLHRQFGELLIGSGLSYSGLVVEVFASRSGGWTIIATDASGKSCLVATGDAWESERAPRVET
jgi:hypothetical protein